jgi:hypothetical protein
MNAYSMGTPLLADFLVNSVTLQERIVLLDLKSFRGVLLVLHRRVPRCWLAFAFGFRAFERDDDACALLGHDFSPCCLDGNAANDKSRGKVPNLQICLALTCRFCITEGDLDRFRDVTYVGNGQTLSDLR